MTLRSPIQAVVDAEAEVVAEEASTVEAEVVTIVVAEEASIVEAEVVTIVVAEEALIEVAVEVAEASVVVAEVTVEAVVDSTVVDEDEELPPLLESASPSTREPVDPVSPPSKV